MLIDLWPDAPQVPPFSVSVCLSALIPFAARSEDLLEPASARQRRRDWENLSAVLDGLNTKYARTVISQGTYIEPPGGYAGGKIAFGRIPDAADFF